MGRVGLGRVKKIGPMSNSVLDLRGSRNRELCLRQAFNCRFRVTFTWPTYSIGADFSKWLRGEIWVVERVAEGHERGGVWGGGVPLPIGVWGGGCVPSPEKFLAEINAFCWDFDAVLNPIEMHNYRPTMYLYTVRRFRPPIQSSSSPLTNSVWTVWLRVRVYDYNITTNVQSTPDGLWSYVESSIKA